MILPFPKGLRRPGWRVVGLALLTFTLNAVLSRVGAGEFEVLGIPVKTVSIMGAAIGVDENDQETLYFNCAQPGNRLFLLQVNAKSGKASQFSAPIGEGARSVIAGPDKSVYLGTWESGYLLKFDPHQPEKGLVSLGKPSATESYIWEFAVGADDRIYGCTYPQARLIRYDCKTGQSDDLGRLDQSEMYARSIAASTNGSLYIGIGTVRAQVVRFDPATGSRTRLLKEDQRPHGTALVSRAVDGRVYARINGNEFRCDGDLLTPVSGTPKTPPMTLNDGRTLTSFKATDDHVLYTLTTPKGRKQAKKAAFDGAGIRIFALAAGPNEHIYGSTALPLEVFDYSPQDKMLRHLGNSTGAEIYSFATDGNLLYACAYPRSYLTVYDPRKAWEFGEQRENNPRGIGYMGAGHLRPRATIIGPDGRVYVGSLAPYGEVGGALGIYDPKQDKVVENYRNIIPDQGISALCQDPATGRIFGGSSSEAGGGARPVAKECLTFAWNPKTRMKEWESAVVAGDHQVVALTAAHGKIFGVSHPSRTLFILDAKTWAVLGKIAVPFGAVHEVSLAYYPPHDSIYGLAHDSIFKVDPKTFAITEVARSKEPISCGIAVTQTGIYFGSMMRLVRWKW